MAQWRIEACTVDDAEGVARNTAGAFWEEPMWRLQWTNDITQDFLTEQLIKLQPLRLLRDRDALRHQKAVDAKSGKLVGYARWRLREGRTATTSPNTPASEPEWAEAQMPDVGADRRQTLDAAAAAAWWDPRTDVDELDTDNDAVRRRVIGDRPYLGKPLLRLSIYLSILIYLPLLTRHVHRGLPELELLAVHPLNQGKGIATSLVESGIRQAEHMGLPVLAIAYKAARGVYQQLGFVEVDRIIKDDSAYGGRGEYSWYFMLYDVPNK